MGKSKWIFFIVSCVLFIPSLQARGKNVSVSADYHSGFDFLDRSVNKIEGDVSSLNTFFESLRRLKESSPKESIQVSIFHLGDSHLQAGFLGGTIMHSFQKDFGNAGRGFVSPLKLAKTNEPFDYDILSANKWIASRCVSIHQKFPAGIGGIALRTGSEPYGLKILCRQQSGFNYSFNKLRIFHSPNTKQIFRLYQEKNKIVEYRKATPFLTELTLAHPCDKLVIECKGGGVPSSSIFGFSLENGRNGVLYHAVGLNGAQFLHYKCIEHFGEQIKALNPRLIILSLGTNEAFRESVTEEQVMREIESLVGPIRKQNAQAAILMTTPAECQYRVPVNGVVKYVPNPKIRIIRKAIIRYAQSHHYPYWDLYRISGGDGSSEKWVGSKMLARDRVHFEVSGYKVQGNLFYQALMYGYNAYLVGRSR